MKTLFIILSLVFFCKHAESQVINQTKTLKGHEYTVLSLDLDKTGKYLVSGSYDKQVILWDFETGKQLKLFKGHNAGVWSVRISPDSKYVASGSWDNNLNAVGSSQNCLNILDLKTFKLITSLSVYPDRFKTKAFIPEFDGYAVNGIKNIFFNDDASKIAALARSGVLFIWDIENDFSKKIYNYGKTKHALRELSPDWNYIACCERKRSRVDSSFYLIKLGANDVVAKFDKPKRAVYKIHFSSSSKYIGCVSGDRIKRNEVDIWDIQTQKLLFTLIGHSNVVRSIAFSSNEKYLASAGEDNLINLWDVSSGKLIENFTENKEKELTSVLFSKDDKYLITGSQDKTIKYWKIKQSTD